MLRRMILNRSAPHACVTPVLTVHDVRAAVAFYRDAFGFAEHVQIGEGHRAQLGSPYAGASTRSPALLGGCPRNSTQARFAHG